MAVREGLTAHAKAALIRKESRKKRWIPYYQAKSRESVFIGHTQFSAHS
jgi:hypothetical protein